MIEKEKETAFLPSLLHAMSAFTDEFVSVWDEEGRDVIFINDSFPFFFGYSDKSTFLKEYHFFGFRKHSIDSDIANLVRETIKKNGLWREEVLFIKKNGDPFLGKLDIVTFNAGDKTYFLQRIINIDNQRVFSENLFKEIKKFEALFQYATVPILLVNKYGEIILANTQATDLFEYSSKEIVKIKVEQLIPTRFRHHHVNHREKYEQKPTNRLMGRGMELRGLKKSGDEFPVEISLGHYMIDNEPYVISFILDITQRKKIEDTLRSQKEQVEKAKIEIEQLNAELENKVEQRTHELMDTLSKLEKSRDELTNALSKERELSDLKSRFVSMASHEFRTPLSTILSSISLIGKYTDSSDQDKRDKHIQRIRSAVSNLTDILNEFLSIGKIEEGKIQVHFSEFNLKDQLGLIINEIKTILKSGQHIFYEHTGNTQVNLDHSLLRNIIFNLISNAIKFSPEGASIRVTSDMQPDSLHISVADQGMGIADEDKKHLFERFFRGKNVINIQGTGLGLHIVSKYVELMNGSIQVESELEKGTTFNIKFNI